MMGSLKDSHNSDYRSISHWYALHVCSRHEKRVADYLHANAIELFLPTYKAVHRWRNGCRTELDLPLFPGYLFVRIALLKQLIVQRCPGVVSLVGFSDQPFALEDAEIEALKSGLQQRPAEPYPFFAIGDHVRVRSGPFAGMVGVLLRRKKDFRVVLSMHIIAKSIAVELDLCNLEPLPLRRSAAHLSADRAGWITSSHPREEQGGNQKFPNNPK